MASAEVSSWLLRNVDLDGDRVHCRLRAGHIAALITASDGASDAAGVATDPDELVIDARGGALLPGLADHHIHLFAAARAATSLDLQGAITLEVLAKPTTTGWLRVTGAGTELRRTDVDSWVSDHPVRVQHRSGALWTLNSAAVALLGSDLTPEERESGQLWRSDARLREMLSTAGESGAPDLNALGATLASWGVTHLTDATPELDEPAIELLDAQLPQHILSLAQIGTGPRKIMVTDHELPALAALIEQIQISHQAGRPVAMHAVSAVGLALTIAAVAAAGSLPGDRVEHAAVCDDSAAEALAALGLIVVTQPSIFARHGSRFMSETPEPERRWLWRYAGLLRAGVQVAVSSDAPYGDPNPWQTIRAAVTHEHESVPAKTALTSMLTDPRNPAGPPRQVKVGMPADLCLLDVPLGEALRRASSVGKGEVAATFVAGRMVHRNVEVVSASGEAMA